MTRHHRRCPDYDSLQSGPSRTIDFNDMSGGAFDRRGYLEGMRSIDPGTLVVLLARRIEKVVTRLAVVGSLASPKRGAELLEALNLRLPIE